MWFGMAAYGRRTWDERGNGFTAYFGLLARLSPFGERDGRLVVRTPLSGLAGAERTPGMLAFVAVMLGTVVFDGFSRATFWQNLRADLEAPYILDSPGTAELISTGLALAGMLAWVLGVACAFLGRHEGRRADDPRAADRSCPTSVQSLVPVALVYAVAHYFTYAAHPRAGCYPARLGSVRLRLGSLRHAGLLSPISVFSPNTVWYVQVGTLVAGHVAGLCVAHDRAVAIASGARCAAVAVRHAGADGRLHAVRLWLLSLKLIAHGGVGGAIVEALLVVSIPAIFLAVWLRERRARRDDAEDQIKPQ